MEELFEKLQKKEEAIAKLEVERRRGRTTPATDADSTTSNPQSTHMESPAADGSIASGACSTLTINETTITCLLFEFMHHILLSNIYILHSPL